MTGKARGKEEDNMCILCVHTLLKVVGYYCYVSDGFPKKRNLDRG